MIKYLFDSSILIYHFNGKLNQRGIDLLSESLTGVGAYSIMSKFEPDAQIWFVRVGHRAVHRIGYAGSMIVS